MDFVGKLADTTVKVVIALVVVGVADRCGVFDPFKNFFKKAQKEAEASK